MARVSISTVSECLPYASNTQSMFDRKLFLLFLQPPRQSMHDRFAILFLDRFRQRNIHCSDLDAVLRFAAVSDAILIHDGFDRLIAILCAGGMRIEETNLRDCLRAFVV